MIDSEALMIASDLPRAPQVGARGQGEVVRKLSLQAVQVELQDLLAEAQVAGAAEDQVELRNRP